MQVGQLMTRSGQIVMLDPIAFRPGGPGNVEGQVLVGDGCSGVAVATPELFPKNGLLLGALPSPVEGGHRG